MSAQMHGPVVLCGTRRILLVSHQTKSLVNHVYRVRSLSDLDAEFGEWLAEAHDVGDGGHLARLAPG
jgi:hypothetical protein